MAPKVEPRVFYDVYSVGEDHAILPEGGSLSQILDRMTGNRVVEVMDVDGDGPDDGDTAILSNGKKVENARFNGPPLIHKLSARKEFYLDLARRNLAGDGVTFNVRNIHPASPEAFAVALAGSMQSYASHRVEETVEEAKEIAASVTDHPVAAGAVVAGAVALSLLPKGRIAMEAVSLIGAVGGTGYIVHDRVDGIVNDRPMGEHDLTAGLCIAGGAAALRGMTVEGVWKNTIQGLRAAGRFVSESIDVTPGLVAVGANGGSFVVSGAAAVPAAATAVATGGGISSAAAGLPISRMVATFANGGGKIQTREVRFSEEFVPDEAAWAQNPAKKSAADIEETLQLTAKELEAAGNADEAAQVTQVLEEVRQNLEVAAELYKRAPEPAVRRAIERILSEVETEAFQLLDHPDPRVAEVVLEGMRQRMGLLRDLAQRLRLASFKVPGNGNGALGIPGGFAVHGPAARLVHAKPHDSLRAYLAEAFRVLQNGTQGKIKHLGGNVTEIRFDLGGSGGAGGRVYYTVVRGIKHILGVGTKRSETAQNLDIEAAKRLAAELGGANLFVLVWDRVQPDTAAPPK